MTPLMQQYHALKAQAGDALLFFRMGDFYELFGPDAETASRVLQITLTSRDKNSPDPMPMAGVPHHSATGYIQKLLKAGYKVAIGEQIEDPSQAKGIVRREITRTFTPAVRFDLEEEPAFLAWVNATPLELVLLEPSTGRIFFHTPESTEELLAILQSERVFHVLHQERDWSAALLKKRLPDVLVETLPPNFAHEDRTSEALKNCFGVGILELALPSQSLAHHLGVLILYVLRSQNVTSLPHLQWPKPLREEGVLKLGPKSSEHLDLPLLFESVDATLTRMGHRRLKLWLLQPLKEPQAILERQKTIQCALPRVSVECEKHLREIYDLERLTGRLASDLANPRDLLALGVSLQATTRIIDLVSEASLALQKPETTPTWMEWLQQSAQIRPSLETLARRLMDSIEATPPLLSREGGIFKKGVSAELDRLIDLNKNGQDWLLRFEAAEKEKTGIGSLKVRYNRVFGYYIEITKTHLEKVPSRYQRKQSTVNAERFFTEELKVFEEEQLSAESKQIALEEKLFLELRGVCVAALTEIQKASALMGELDAWRSLATLLERPGWSFPIVDHSVSLEIKRGRHPVLETTLKGEFVPNDLRLGEGHPNFLIVTGPNMGGKSTTMRQVALLVILGQAGAPIPALAARFGYFSSIYTRIGANDAIHRGQSTFMVEMTELAHLLHSADSRSLLILDEIGRGTSTYDGMSVAGATIEWVQKNIKARTLFATHYHELTSLEQKLEGLGNIHVTAESHRAGELKFLYELQAGPASESFGIRVGELAGLPQELTERAYGFLKELENQSGQTSSLQLSLFAETREKPKAIAPDPKATLALDILKRLESIEPDQLSPRQALDEIYRLRSALSAPRT